MNNHLFVKVEEIAENLQISKPLAYKIVRDMNEELNQKGYITIAGRVSRQFYEEKFYGIKNTNVR